MTLEEIRDKKLGAVINTKTKDEALLLVKILGVDENRFYDETDFINVWDAFKENTCYRVIDGKVDMSDCVKYYQSIHEKIYKFSDLFATGGVVSIHDLSTSEWYNPMRLTFKNGSSIEALPQKDDAVRGKNHFCDGFRGGKIPNDLIVSHTEMERAMDRLLKTLEEPSVKFGIKKLEQKLKEEKNLKFTFYTEEGYRIDKSNNSKVETITTFVKINGFDNTYLGMATCDKVDYSEREGVINALANAMCNGNFDREFNKAVKDNARADKKARTCTYCGQLFDTVEEKQAHEAWHVERKKARRERYLLRKRAKEIAFEEQAQKMAKEMMGEQK